ncbi:MAG: carboxypeptidase-like regulatory domain-containing protein [Flavobacteriaceae bacterium]|nr:carboxypeptidase-like regulatory domain-containing protein [Flavobacteriaceae bacterium]
MGKGIFIAAFLATLFVNGQVLRKNIKGEVFNDSISVENVHVINKNIKLGVATNKSGKFIIPVRLNDTLIFSSVQFEQKIVVIKKSDLDRDLKPIKLSTHTIQLDEVVLFSHKMIGNLAIDGSRFKGKSLGNLNYLDFKGIDFDVLLSDEVYKNSKINRKILSSKTNSDVVSGGDILGLIKYLKRSPNKNYKKASKEEQQAIRNQILTTTNTIRRELKDAFFKSSLKLSSDKINDFLYFAIDKKMADLYNANKKIEIIAYLIKIRPYYKN